MTRQQRYRQRWKVAAEHGFSECACGHPAVALRANSPICARCLDWETWYWNKFLARSEEDLHQARLRHSVDQWARKQARKRERWSALESPTVPGPLGILIEGAFRNYAL